MSSLLVAAGFKLRNVQDSTEESLRKDGRPNGKNGLATSGMEALPWWWFLCNGAQSGP